jgi:hypothetical protein
MVKYTLDCVVGVCFSQRHAQPRRDGLCDVFVAKGDPVKYVALLSAIMAVTEDLVFMSVASMFVPGEQAEHGARGVHTFVLRQHAAVLHARADGGLGALPRHSSGFRRVPGRCVQPAAIMSEHHRGC